MRKTINSFYWNQVSLCCMSIFVPIVNAVPAEYFMHFFFFLYCFRFYVCCHCNPVSSSSLLQTTSFVQTYVINVEYCRLLCDFFFGSRNSHIAFTIRTIRIAQPTWASPPPLLHCKLDEKKNEQCARTRTAFPLFSDILLLFTWP